MPTVEAARAWYQDDPVHGFDHVLRVMRTAEQLGIELDADLEILRAAALLHDSAGAHPVEAGERVEHEIASAAFARNVLVSEGWDTARIDAVTHCIRAHRFRGQEEPETIEAKIIYDADKLDVIGAFGAARTIGYAIQAGLPIFAEPSERFIKSGETEPGELHSAYHEYLYKLQRVHERLYTEPARRVGERRQKLLKAFFEQLAAEARGKD